MLIVLAQLGTPEGVGQFALGLAVTAPVIMLTNLQLRAVQATDSQCDYRFADYLALRIIMVLVAVAAILGIAFLSGYTAETALVVLVIGLGKCFDALSDIYYGFLQQHERMDRIAKSHMAKGVLSLTLLAGAMLLTGSVLWSSVAWSGASLLVLLVYDLRSRGVMTNEDPEPQRRPDTRTLWTLARLSFPLGVTMMLISLNSNIPRYFLERHGGEYAVGIYSSIAYLMVAGTTVISALGQSASPRLAQYFALRNIQAYDHLLLRLVVIGLLLGGIGVTGAVIAGEPILELLYGDEYAAAADSFVWLMVAASITYVSSFFGYAVTATRIYKGLIPVYALIAALTAGAAALLIPRFNIGGAALTVGVTSASSALLLFSLLVYHRAKRFNSESTSRHSRQPVR